MSIRVLDKAIAGKIAAGEVIQRPASVVKELVENAIDAGATRVVVTIERGGQQLIRVTDDGQGIASGDVPIALKRYATSKISSEEDLASIETLGFRGEALPSIAAVSRMMIATRQPNDPTGTELRAEAGEITGQRSIASAGGTTITVQGLFYNTPARLKFMRSQGSETGQIASTVCQYALAYPSIQFRLVDSGRSVFSTPGNGKLIDAIANLYGADAAQAMVPLGEPEAAAGLDLGDRPSVTVSGFTSKPSFSRANRAQISFFANGRWVQNRFLAFALEEAYHSLLPQGRHPVAVVYIDLDHRQVDVNVHPGKLEVRFVNEREVFGAVQRAVRLAVTRLPEVAEFQTADTLVSPVEESIQRRLALEDAVRGVGPVLQTEQRQPVEMQPSESAARRLPILRVLGQVAATYIVAEGPDGMYLIDQHTAHERVLYDKLLEQGRSSKPDLQLLLDPTVVELPPGVAQDSDNVEELRRMGFEIEPFGARAVIVRAVPIALGLSGGAVAGVVLEALAEFEQVGDNAARPDALAASLACHSAVRAGQVLTSQEMQRIIHDLERTDSPLTCAHGRPTMLHVSQELLEKQFGRR